MSRALATDPKEPVPHFSASAMTNTRPRALSAFSWTFATHACRYLGLLVLIPFYGRVLGPEGYGSLLTAMSVYMVVWIVANWGFSAAGTRRIAASDERSTHVDELCRQIHGRLLAGSAALLIGCVMTASLPILQSAPDLGLLASLHGIVSACNFGWYFQGRGRYRVMTLIEVTNLAGGTALVLFLVSGPADAALALRGLLAVNLICLAVATLNVLGDLGWPRVRLHGGIALLRESAALFGAGGLAMIAANSSGLIVGVFATAREVAFYGAAERIVSVVLALTQPIDQVVLPAISERLGANDKAGANSMIRRAVMTLAVAGCVAALIALTLAGWAMPFVFGPDFGPSVPIMQAFAPVLALMLIAHGLNVYVLIAQHLDKAVALGLSAGTVIGLVAMVALIPSWGGVGAAVSRAVAFGVTVAVVLVYLVRSGRFSELVRR